MPSATLDISEPGDYYFDNGCRITGYHFGNLTSDIDINVDTAPVNEQRVYHVLWDENGQRVDHSGWTGYPGFDTHTYEVTEGHTYTLSLSFADSIMSASLTHRELELRKYVLNVTCQAAAWPAPDVPPLKDAIWSEEGFNRHESHVELDLTRGVYNLQVLYYDNEKGNGNISLSGIISRPDDCVPWSQITFPARLPITVRKCKLYATLEVYLGLYAPRRRVNWSVGITKAPENVPPAEQADGWSAQGSGHTVQPLMLRFTPGVWRFGKGSRSWSGSISGVTFGEIGCIKGVWNQIEPPTQFTVSSNCIDRFTLTVGSHIDSPEYWEYSIIKLE